MRLSSLSFSNVGLAVSSCERRCRIIRCRFTPGILAMRSFLAILLAAPMGCVSNPGAGDTSSGAAAATQSNEERRAAEIERRSSARPQFEAKPAERAPRPIEDGVTGEAPAELLHNMKKDLAARLSAGNANITVVVAEAVTWNDGSLGCPQPGGLYTQATVPGYRVVLELAGQRYSYHADAGGYFVPCDFQLMMPPGKTPIQ